MVFQRVRQYLRAHLGSVVACAGIVLVAGISAWLLDDNEMWGALGQWAGAFGAVLAVTVALRIAQREAENEAERRRAAKADHDIEQARLVVAVLEYPTPAEDYHFERETGDTLPPLVRIINYSATHVFYPRVEGFQHQNGGSVTWDVAGDGWDAKGPATVLAPGGMDEALFLLTYEPPITKDMYPIRTKVIIGFTDADGRRWRRVAEARPTRIEDNDTFVIGGPAWYRVDE